MRALGSYMEDQRALTAHLLSDLRKLQERVTALEDPSGGDDM